MTSEATIREVQCRATVIAHDHHGNERPHRCDWRGPASTFADHTDETGHEQCILCAWGLADHEQRVCTRCLDRVRDDLADIETSYATLPEIVDHSGYRMGRLPGGDALVMLADGSMASPQIPNWHTQPREVAPTVHVEHTQMIGRDVEGNEIIHPPYVEERIPSDGREHVRDHWKNDPVSILAALEALERDWRRTFGHHPADDLTTVIGSLGYLRRWLTHAAAHHESFEDAAHEIRELRSRVQHVAGLADDPETAPADCFDCGGQLLRNYRPLRLTLEERLTSAVKAVTTDDRRVAKHRKQADVKPLRVPARTTRVRQAVAGDDREGLADALTCARCKKTYAADEYGLLLRMRANSIQGWVTVRVAAETLRRHEKHLWRWVHDLAIPAACSVITGRVYVDWEAAKTHSDATPTRNRHTREKQDQEDAP